MDRKIDVIDIDKPITVASLQGQLSRVFGMGTLDGGFPIVTRQESGGVRGWKMLGYISHNELEHALSQWSAMFPITVIDWGMSGADVVKDEPEAAVQFHALPPPRDYAPSTISSLYDSSYLPDPLDFTVYMDQVPDSGLFLALTYF